MSVETAREICAKLPESVEKIRVFVDPGVDPGRSLLNAGLRRLNVSAEGIAGGRGSAIKLNIIPCDARLYGGISKELFQRSRS